MVEYTPLEDGKKSNRRLCIKVAVMVLVVAIITAIAVTLGILLTRKNKPTGPSLNDKISQNATFPNGSYLITVNSLKTSSNVSAPLQLNVSMLIQFGIRVDNSSFVAETGRLSYFYIWLPPPSAKLTNNKRQKRSAAVNGPNMGNIGIRFGNAATINVIPLSLASLPKSGLCLLKQLSDKSSIYQLEVRMPDSMCDSSIKMSTCTLTSWQPYSISSDAKTGEPGDFTVSLPVACGSQCSSPSSSPCATSCDTCDGQQVAGADTPVTRRYSLGATSAKVNFLYETYKVKDQIIVNYQGKVLFDSGCVGTQGEKRTTIKYSGDSDELRVDVEPNCEGTKATEWYFTLACPTPCEKTATRQGAILMNDKIRIKNGGIAYISSDAQMPPLTAHYCGNGTGISWLLKITPIAHVDSNICNQQSYTKYGNPWDIFQMISHKVQGGDATLSWIDSQKNTGSIKFKILGIQPLYNDVVSEIKLLTNLWYPQYVAVHESRLRQFDDKTGYPLKSFDDGFGVFQLTNPKPNCDQVWSWKQNVAEGVSRLNSFDAAAHTWMVKQRQQAKQEERCDVPVPDHTDGKCIFKENSSKIIEDAVAMKMYNGASGGNYCAWKNKVGSKPGKWTFHEFNTFDPPFDYVNRVCQNVS